ncbi:MAG: Rv3654c family TadE-like protein [Ornithinimicrobium sp.]
MSARWRSGQRGSATVLAVGVVGVIVSLFAAAAVLAAVTIARNQAHTAADLAAVAGAQLVALGRSQHEICERALSTAADNGAQMSSCEVVGGGGGAPPEVVVDVLRPVVAGVPWVTRSSGRAGLVVRG